MGLADVIVKATLERLWHLGEVPEDWEKANIVPVFTKGKEENTENYRLVIFNLIPGRVMEQIILKITSKHANKKVIGSIHHGFMKSQLTSLLQ